MLLRDTVALLLYSCVMPPRPRAGEPVGFDVASASAAAAEAARKSGWQKRPSEAAMASALSPENVLHHRRRIIAGLGLRGSERVVCHDRSVLERADAQSPESPLQLQSPDAPSPLALQNVFARRMRRRELTDSEDEEEECEASDDEEMPDPPELPDWKLLLDQGLYVKEQKTAQQLKQRYHAATSYASVVATARANGTSPNQQSARERARQWRPGHKDKEIPIVDHANLPSLLGESVAPQSKGKERRS